MEATALYYKTLEIFNMNLPFFLVIYNIILTVFCLIVFSDPIIVSPTPGAALSLRDLQDRKKTHGKWQQKNIAGPESVLFAMGSKLA